MTPRRAAVGLAAALVTLVLGGAGGAHAGIDARFAAPDSALAGALRSIGAGYERAWNALLVSELRATLARADSAARYHALAKRVARAEPEALGSHIAPDAWRLRTAWAPRELRARVQAAVAESLGQAAQDAADWPRADSLFRRALAGYRSVRETRRAAWVLGNLEVVATNSGALDRADSLARVALAARRALGDSVMTGNTLYDLGVIAARADRPHDALMWFTASAASRAGAGETARRAGAMRGMADAHRDLGERPQALTLYAEALALASAAGDSARVSEIASAHGALLIAMDRPREGVAVLERARGIAAGRGDRALEARVLCDQAEADRLMGDPDAGIARLDRACMLTLAAGDPATRCRALARTGRLWVEMGDAAAARPPLERALALSDSLADPRGTAEVLAGLALAHQLEDDPAAAAKLADRALAAALTTGDPALVHDVAATGGRIAAEQGRLDDARARFERAVDAHPGAGLSVRAEDQLELGNVASRQGRADDATAAFTRAVALADSGGLGAFRAQAWLGFADVAEQRGSIGDALAWDRRAASLVDSLPAREYPGGAPAGPVGRWRSPYDALIHRLGRFDPRVPDSGFAAEAFVWSERARRRASRDAGAPASDAPPLTLAATQRALAPGTALLCYSLGDSSGTLWVVSAKRWRRVTLPPRKRIRDLVEPLAGALGDRAASDLPATRAAARALYRLAIEPVEKDLKGAKHLIVAPDGPLARVPFGALLIREPAATGALPKGSWLIERWPVSVVPSASALPRLARGARGAGILALGDPDYGRAQTGRAPGGDAPPGGAPAAGSLPRLPHTAAEIVAITAEAGGRPVRVLTGATATRDSLLAARELPRAEVVHLGTHGIASASDPSRSGLWLAAPDTSSWPGFLAIADIRALRLDAAVVTLSVCASGTGRRERGDDVPALARAFLDAGAGSVVVSRWSVNDASSAMLMNAFYRELLIGGAERDVALATAQRALLARPETRAPFHWAPYLLVGANGALAAAR